MNWIELRSARLHLVSFVCGVALIVWLTRLAHYLPAEYYFSFAGFLYSADISDPSVQGQLNWFSLVIKLLTPVLAGFVIGLVWREDGVPSAGPAGFAAALLLCWPGIVEWDLIANPQVHDRRNQFLLLYALYIGSFAYLCAAGARVGPAARAWLGARIGMTEPGKILIDWNKIVGELVKSAVLGGASFAVGYVLK